MKFLLYNSNCCQNTLPNHNAYYYMSLNFCPNLTLHSNHIIVIILITLIKVIPIRNIFLILITILIIFLIYIIILIPIFLTANADRRAVSFTLTE